LKAKEEDLSDTEDSEMERDAWDDPDSADEQDLNSSMRSQLEKLTRDALANPEEEGLLEAAEKEDEEDERPLPSARWQCPDEEWIVNEGLEVPVPGQKVKEEYRGDERESRRKGGIEEMVLNDSDDEGDGSQDIKPRLTYSTSDPSTSTSLTDPTLKRKATSIEPGGAKADKKPKVPRESPPAALQAEGRVCFICDRELRGSEVAFNSHVNACLGQSVRLSPFLTPS
jgi:hypothetical protein